jgi:hypothetical protein
MRRNASFFVASHFLQTACDIHSLVVGGVLPIFLIHPNEEAKYRAFWRDLHQLAAT